MVLHPEDEDGVVLLRELRRAGCIAHLIWPLPKILPDTLGGMFCVLDADARQFLISLGGSIPAPVVGLVSRTQPELFTLVRDCAPHALLFKPVIEGQVIAALCLAKQLYLYQHRLQKRVGKLDETLKSVRKVEQAKSILMTTKKLSEHDAYHFMRRQAMELRVPIGTIATTIINAHRIYD